MIRAKNARLTQHMPASANLEFSTLFGGPWVARLRDDSPVSEATRESSNWEPKSLVRQRTLAKGSLA
jgi:hypothetical protein